MATYTANQLYGNGVQGEDISTSLTFTFNNPSGSSYFTVETVQDRTGSFSGKQRTTSGSWVPSSSSMGPVQSDYFASVVVQPGTCSVTLTPASSITGSNYRMKGTGAFSVTTSGGVTVYSFIITECCYPSVISVYSISPVFAVGIRVFTDPQLTLPYTQPEYGGTRLGDVGCPFSFDDGYVVEDGYVTINNVHRVCD